MVQKSQQKEMTKIFILVICPLIVLLLPKTIFNNSQYTICILKRITGNDCLGCGMTRACMHLIHLDFEAAAHFNKISFVVLPILCFLWIRELVKSLKEYQKAKDTAGFKK